METVIPLNKSGVESQESEVSQKSEGSSTGVFFYEQTPEALIKAIQSFEKSQDIFDSYEIRKNAERFNKDRFKKEFKGFVENKVDEYFHMTSGG